MLEKDRIALRAASPYSAVVTREQFLFYEVRTTAKLICQGLSGDKIVERIVKENLFRYPTEKSLKQMARTCLHRLNAPGGCVQDSADGVRKLRYGHRAG